MRKGEKSIKHDSVSEVSVRLLVVQGTQSEKVLPFKMCTLPQGLRGPGVLL